MNIVSSELQFASAHRFQRVETTLERLQLGGRGQAATADGPEEAARARVPTVVLSSQGQALAAAERAETDADAAGNAGDAAADAIEAAAEEARKDPRNQLLIALVEYLTGRRIRLIDGRDFAAPAQREGSAQPVDHPPPESSSRPPAAGFSLQYERHHRIEEYEATRFSAQGLIRTADGQVFRFALELDMERVYRQESHVAIRIGEAERKDPLVINLSGSAAQLRDQRFDFDLDADGELDALPTLARGSGYLVFDRNGDGKVEDGSELFGAISGDGYADLSALDEDGNGWIDAADAVSEQLYLWRPESGGDAKLITLAEAGVAALSTSRIATPFALRGEGNADLGAVRSTGLYLSTARTVGTTQQIDLSV